MKKILFAMALAVAFVACNHNEPTDTKKDGTDTIPLHQPTDSTWSPVGHIYVYETTYKNSPAPDKYWAWVLNFYDFCFVVEYETPNRDLSYHQDYLRTVDSVIYRLSYPNLLLDLDTGREFVFTDTLHIHTDLWGVIDYRIFK